MGLFFFKKHRGQLGKGNLGKSFLKNHAHLGEFNSEKISVVVFCVFIIFGDFQNYTSNDQNAISAYFASRFYSKLECILQIDCS